MEECNNHNKINKCKKCNKCKICGKCSSHCKCGKCNFRIKNRGDQIMKYDIDIRINNCNDVNK